MACLSDGVDKQWETTMSEAKEAYAGELQELREDRVRLLDQNAKLLNEIRTLKTAGVEVLSEYIQAQINYDRFG